jgi:hypothetical protein
VCGVFGFYWVARFDRLRRLHVLAIPLVGADGQQLVDARGKKRVDRVVIGTEGDLMPAAKKDLQRARRQRGGLSLAGFMSGYGAGRVNDPEALWDRSVLATAGTRITVALMFVVLLGVTTLFIAAFLIEVAGRTP